MDRLFEIEPLETFIKVSEEVLLNLYVSKQLSDTDLDARVVQAAKEDLQKLIEDSHLDNESLTKQLQMKASEQNWSEDKVNSLASIIEKNKTDLLYATILYYNSKYGNTVQNFDWALKLIKGTNNLKTLSYPLLQLNFSSRNSEGELIQSQFDVNKDMLEKLISVLENKDSL